MEKHVLAFDLGASSGRAILGSVEDNKLSLQEIHRFENKPIYKNDTLHWDIYTLFYEMKKSIQLAFDKKKVSSIAIDTWGVDFGIFDPTGLLISGPVHYRDKRTDGMVEEVLRIYTNEELYELTGNQIMNINTIFQLAFLKKYHDVLSDNNTLMLMPDLFNYLLTGERKSEETIASTTQLFDPYEKKWNEKIIKRLGFPAKMFADVIKPGNEIGKVSKLLMEELSIPETPVLAVCSHDTASAVVSVPAKEDFLFISCGTWALIGTELQAPIINEKSKKYNLTNESGFDGTTRFLKNITGLWLIQEVKKQFEREGRYYSYNDFNKIANEAPPFKCFIDTDFDDFQIPGDIPSRIRKYARVTKQTVPQTDGELIRCIYESLAFKFRTVFNEIEECVDKKYQTVHIVGGGSQASILCQMVADVSQLNVIAGPVEATAIGNCIVQLIALNEIKDLNQGREMVQSSFEVLTYVPSDVETWKKQYSRYQKVVKDIKQVRSY